MDSESAIHNENKVEQSEETNEIPTLTRHQRYHALNREKRINYQLERYHNDPDVIAKREAREKAKAEREAEKKAKKEQEKAAEKSKKDAEKAAEKVAAKAKKDAEKTKSPASAPVSPVVAPVVACLEAPLCIAIHTTDKETKGNRRRLITHNNLILPVFVFLYYAIV